MNANGPMVDFSATGEAAGSNEEEGFVVDFANVPDQAAFPVIPRGVYDAVVDDLTFGHSQSSGNPMWTWRFELEGEEHKKRKLFFHSTFIASTMPRVKKTLAALAPELLSAPFDPKKVAESGEMLGRRCRLRVDISKYQNQDRNNVRDVLAATAGGAGVDSFLS